VQGALTLTLFESNYRVQGALTLTLFESNYRVQGAAAPDAIINHFLTWSWCPYMVMNGNDSLIRMAYR